MIKKVFAYVLMVVFVVPVLVSAQTSAISKSLIITTSGSWQKGTNNYVTWKQSGLSGNKGKISLVSSTNKEYVIANEVSLKNGKRLIGYRKLIDIPEGQYSIKLVANSNPRITASSTTMIDIKASAQPTLVFTSPSNNAQIDAQKPLRITWYSNFIRGRNYGKTGEVNIVPNYGIGANSKSILLDKLSLADRDILNSVNASELTTLIYIINQDDSTLDVILEGKARPVEVSVKTLDLIRKLSPEGQSILVDMNPDHVTDLKANNAELNKNADNLKDLTDDYENGKTKLIIFAQSIDGSGKKYILANTNVEASAKKVNLKSLPQGTYTIGGEVKIKGVNTRFNTLTVNIFNTEKKSLNDISKAPVQVTTPVNENLPNSSANTGQNPPMSTVPPVVVDQINNNQINQNNVVDNANNTQQNTAIQQNVIPTVVTGEITASGAVEAFGYYDRNSGSVSWNRFDNFFQSAAWKWVINISNQTNVDKVIKSVSISDSYQNSWVADKDGSQFLKITNVNCTKCKVYDIFPKNEKVRTIKAKTTASIAAMGFQQLYPQYVNNWSPRSYHIKVEFTDGTNTEFDTPVNNLSPRKGPNESVQINLPKNGDVWYKGQNKTISLKGPKVLTTGYDMYLVKLIDSSGNAISNFATVDTAVGRFDRDNLMVLFNPTSKVMLSDSLPEGEYTMSVAFCRAYYLDCKNEDFTNLPSTNTKFKVKNAVQRRNTSGASVFSSLENRRDFESWLLQIGR